MFTIITANVNGIRAAERRGGLHWLRDADPDVLCLQEVRATHEQLHEALAGSHFESYAIAHVPAPQLGRAGVAILTKAVPSAKRERVNAKGLDGLGRWVEVDLETEFGLVTVVSVYVHAGEEGTTKQDEKYAFLEAMTRRLKTLRTKAAKNGTHVVFCGDINIARAEVDIKNWRANRDKAGFLPQEREIVNAWFAKDWIDIGRELGGEGPGPYTWWSWRGRGFDTDGGWRIDYVAATPGLAAFAKTAVVGKAPTYAERWSDHAPLTVTFAR